MVLALPEAVPDRLTALAPVGVGSGREVVDPLAGVDPLAVEDSPVEEEVSLVEVVFRAEDDFPVVFLETLSNLPPEVVREESRVDSLAAPVVIS